MHDANTGSHDLFFNKRAATYDTVPRIYLKVMFYFLVVQYMVAIVPIRYTIRYHVLQIFGGIIYETSYKGSWN